MSCSAERVQPIGSLRRALLPETQLGLVRELSSDIEVVGLRLASPQDVLSRLGEPSSLPRAVPKRRAEFAAGRHASALALAHFGCLDPVQREQSGAPRWPAGFVGSISHGADIAVAVVASSSDYRALGVDVEEWISDAQCRELADRILKPEELGMLRETFPELSSATLVSLGFSAKESLYKCLNPIAEEFIEFEDARLVRVRPRTPTSGQIWLSLTKPFSGELAAGTELPGCYALEPDRVETLVWFSWRHA